MVKQKAYGLLKDLLTRIGETAIAEQENRDLVTRTLLGHETASKRQVKAESHGSRHNQRTAASDGSLQGNSSALFSNPT